jgi:hypothetical protein
MSLKMGDVCVAIAQRYKLIFSLCCHVMVFHNQVERSPRAQLFGVALPGL